METTKEKRTLISKFKIVILCLVVGILLGKASYAGYNAYYDTESGSVRLGFKMDEFKIYGYNKKEDGTYDVAIVFKNMEVSKKAFYFNCKEAPVMENFSNIYQLEIAFSYNNNYSLKHVFDNDLTCLVISSDSKFGSNQIKL